MKQSEKLKVVFDFIADYLTEDNKSKKDKKKGPTTKEPTTKGLIVEGGLITKGDYDLSKFHDIMKMIEEKYYCKEPKVSADLIAGKELGTNNVVDVIKFREIDSEIKRVEGDLIKELSPRLTELKKEIDKIKGTQKTLLASEEGFDRLGVTVDNEGKVVNVKVKPLTENSGEIKSNIDKILTSEIKKKK